jgi:hypothetical protein
VGRPDAVDFVQQGRLVELKAARRQLFLHGGDGRFKCGIFAGDKSFGCHAVFSVKGMANRRELAATDKKGCQ